MIRRCLEPDPADRYALAAELAADLQAVADDAPLCFAREPEPEPNATARVEEPSRTRVGPGRARAGRGLLRRADRGPAPRGAWLAATSTRAFARHRPVSSPRPPPSLPWRLTGPARAGARHFVHSPIEADQPQERSARGRADPRPRRGIFPQGRADSISSDHRTWAQVGFARAARRVRRIQGLRSDTLDRRPRARPARPGAARAADRRGERGLVPLGDGLGPARRSRTGAAGRGGL